MPRAPRQELAGGLHHVTARAPKGLQLFRSDADCVRYLDLLAKEVAERDWSLRSYSLMINHLHLLVWTPEADLGAGIKRAHETFVREIHRERDGHGHLFGDRFYNRIVSRSEHEVACLRYIARNPVEADLCASPALWRWGAHPALAGLVAPPPFLDVDAVLEVLPRSDYVELCESADTRLLEQLAGRRGDTWPADAADDYAIRVEAIAAKLNVHPSTAYRRISAAREKRDSPLFRG